MKKFLILAVPVFLAGCGLPPAISIASWALDGVLLAASGKTSTDHAISIVTQQDCAMWRIVKGEEICSEIAPGELDGVAIAQNDLADDDSLSEEEMAAVGAELSEIATAAGAEEIDDSSYQVSYIPFGVAQTYAGDELAALPKKSPRMPLPVARPFGQPVPTYFRSPAEDPALGAIPAKPSESGINTSALPDSDTGTPRQIAALSVLSDAQEEESGEVISSPAAQQTVARDVSVATVMGDSASYLVLGSFRNRQNADRRAEDLSRFDAFVVTAQVKGKQYYRVLAGAPDGVEISVYQTHVKKITGNDSWVVTLCSDGSQAISCSARRPMVSAALSAR